MNERLLTKAERKEALALGPGNVPAVDIYLEAQDKKTSAARLRECGEWLKERGACVPSRPLVTEVDYAQLERGEAPWEAKP